VVRKRFEVGVIGSGLAGAAAADVFNRHGVSVIVLDDHPSPGGHYLRAGRNAGTGWADQVRRRGLMLVEGLLHSRAVVLSRADVIGLEKGFQILAVDGNGKLATVDCERILLATGARERVMPFPGWTLPGVLSTGAAQNLIKHSGVLPARAMLVGGAGFFPARVSHDIYKNRGRVVGVLNETSFFNRLPTLDLLLGNSTKLIQGGVLLAGLRLAGVPRHDHTRILEASGHERLRAVRTVRIDRNGEVIPGSEAIYRIDCLAVGFGFTANIELAQLAGCEVTFNSEQGGWVVKVNEDLETSVDGISAAGEITAIGGAAKSLTEGQLAALAILKRMALSKSPGLDREISALKKTRKRQMAFGRYFNSQYSFTQEYMSCWIRSLPDDVTVCRCEEVTLGDLRRAIAEGFCTPAGLKKATRCGMGICQGNTCKTILLEVLSALTGKPLASISPPSARMPIRPAYLGTLAGGGL
jgi:D-hydroxyproline dehydrogenase subunit alpha